MLPQQVTAGRWKQTHVSCNYRCLSIINPVWKSSNDDLSPLMLGTLLNIYHLHKTHRIGRYISEKKSMGTSNCLVINIHQNVSRSTEERNWYNLRVSKWWQNIHFLGGELSLYCETNTTITINNNNNWWEWWWLNSPLNYVSIKRHDKSIFSSLIWSRFEDSSQIDD